MLVEFIDKKGKIINEKSIIKGIKTDEKDDFSYSNMTISMEWRKYINTTIIKL